MTATYLEEIMEQPAMLAALSRGLAREVHDDLAQVGRGLRSGDYDRVILTGMGGSLHGCYPLYLQLSQTLAVPVLLADASELVQQFPEAIGARSLLIAVSQSGESGEIVELTRLAPRRPGTVVSVTNGPDNTLSRWADIRLCSLAGPEQTVSSKTYTGGLACLHLLGGALAEAGPLAGRELARAAEACARLLADWRPAVERVVAGLDARAPLVFVGRGKSLASARLAALLTQEAAKLPCHALSGGQFRHGPIELARAGFTMVAFLGDRKTRDLDMALVGKVLGHGGRVVAVTPAGSAPAAADGLAVLTYPDVPVPLNPVLEAVLVQLLQIPLAPARGFTAGQFLNATKVTGLA